MPSRAMSPCDIVTELERKGDTMILDHPVIPLVGRLMMAYIFATSGIGKIWMVRNVAYMTQGTCR